jgi:hypothetical protein
MKILVVALIGFFVIQSHADSLKVSDVRATATQLANYFGEPVVLIGSERQIEDLNVSSMTIAAPQPIDSKKRKLQFNEAAHFGIGNQMFSFGGGVATFNNRLIAIASLGLSQDVPKYGAILSLAPLPMAKSIYIHGEHFRAFKITRSNFKNYDEVTSQLSGVGLGAKTSPRGPDGYIFIEGGIARVNHQNLLGETLQDNKLTISVGFGFTAGKTYPNR